MELSLTQCMCRWLKASGVSIASEEGMGKIARGIIGDSLKGEIALFFI